MKMVSNLSMPQINNAWRGAVWNRGDAEPAMKLKVNLSLVKAAFAMKWK